MKVELVQTFATIFTVLLYIFISVLIFPLFKDIESRYIDQKENEDKLYLTFEITASFLLMIFIVYGIRVFIEQIPFPLEGTYGYKHNLFRTEYLTGSCEVIAGTLIMYKSSIHDKITKLMEKRMEKSILSR
tara:strand:+ start:2033 stop:2425 length:393 start_codon:yes stop_codon:yes gene_type:complete